MSNRIVTLIVVLAVACLLTSPLFAQPAAPQAAPAAKAAEPAVAGPQGPGAGGDNPERMVERVKDFLESLNLTADQKEKVKPIIKAQREAAQKWRTENEPKFKKNMEDMRAARQANDEKAIEAARAEMKTLAESRKALHEDFMKKLGGVLNDEQMAKLKAEFAEARAEVREHVAAMHPALEGWQKLDLTPEQREKVEKIRADANAQIMSILTPEQQTKLKANMENREERREQMRERGAQTKPAGAGSEKAPEAKPATTK